MKVEIKTNEKGYCDYFIINGQKYGKGIASATILIQAGAKPSILLSGKLDELEFIGNDVYIYPDKKMSLLKRLKRVFKNCKK